MNLFVLFGLTFSEMGLNPPLLGLVIFFSALFIVGFVKSSRENEYKQLMDDFIKKKED